MKGRRLLLLLSEAFANGGIQRFNRTLLASIESLGFDCDVYTLADNEESRRKWLSAESILRVHTFNGDKPRFGLAAIRAVASAQYDHIVIGHVHFLELVVGARLFGRRGGKLWLVAHGVEVWNRLHRARRKALSAVDKILCVSEFTAQTMRGQAPRIPADRFIIFPNALADLWVAKVDGLSAAAAKDSGSRYLLAVARLSRHDRTKGIITAIEAFAQLADRRLRFAIAGDGDDLPFLRQISERLGVADRVDLLGAVSDSELVALYRNCQAFVLPSGQEGFGIVFLEAMYFGAPVIAAREKGAVDVIRDGHTGLLVDYGDVVALAAAITRVLGDSALRESLRNAARSNVTGDGCFTATAFTQRLASLLGETDRRRQVVFVNRYFHPDESATSRMLSDLARRLSRAGLRVAVVTSRQLYDDPDARLPAESVVDGVTVHRVKTATLGRGNLLGRALDYLTFHLAAGARLRRILRPGDIVLAKTDPPMLSVTVARAARARDAVLVNWLQDVFPEAANELGVAIRPAWLATWLRRMRNASLRQAVCNVAIGSRMADRLVTQGVPAASVRVIPNWADVAEIVPQPVEGNRVRAELDLGGKFVVGYSGNLGRAHEFETFLEAAALLDGEDFVFLITGGGAKTAALRRNVDARGLRNFRFQPYQPANRLAENMAAADVHLVSLLPQIEGLIVPSKFYGILAAGRPAVFIGDPDGELAREIRAGECGIALEVGDSAGLAAHLRRMRADPQWLARLGANARALAEQRYSSEQALHQWLGVFAAIMPGAEAASALPLLRGAQSGT